MKRILLLISVLMLWGCDPQVSKTPIGSHTEVRQVNCEKWGYCYNWDPATEGMSWHLSSTCDGSQSAQLRVDDYKVTYKSGAQDIQHETFTEKFLSECR